MLCSRFIHFYRKHRRELGTLEKKTQSIIDGGDRKNLLNERDPKTLESTITMKDRRQYRPVRYTTW